MTRIALLSATVVLFFGCATTPSLNDADFDILSQSILNGPSLVDPLRFEVLTDFTDVRLTLLRASTDRGVLIPDQPAGIYLGNGLFIDSAGNMSVLVDKIIGIKKGYTGRIIFRNHYLSISSGLRSETTVRTIEFTQDKIRVFEQGITSGSDISYTAKTDGTGGDFYLNKVVETDGKIISKPTFLLNPIVENTWERKADIITNSWGTFLSPFTRSIQYELKENKVSLKNSSFIVENTGKYTRIANPALLNKYAYRIYRTNKCFLIVDELTRNTVRIDITAVGATWVTGKDNLRYSVELMP